jgi:hypothetical protein
MFERLKSGWFFSILCISPKKPNHNEIDPAHVSRQLDALQ